MSVVVDPATVTVGAVEGLVSVRIGGQAFGVPVLAVQDVIAQTAINRVPLGPAEVAGSLNLRGRIVTAIDMRQRLRTPPRRADEGFMSVIVERHGELYALLVDDVGDVLWLPENQHEPPPVTLSPQWRRLCSGLYRLEDELLLVLNVEEVLVLDPASVPPPVRVEVEPVGEPKAAPSLFARLGGAAAVEAAVDIFYRKVLADERIKSFFEGVDMTRQVRAQRAFLTMLMGGPNNYTGASLRASHGRLAGKGLGDVHFDAVVEHLGATLRELGAAPADVAEAAALAEGARGDVLNR